jgi:hypothetical protein
LADELTPFPPSVSAHKWEIGFAKSGGITNLAGTNPQILIGFLPSFTAWHKVCGFLSIASKSNRSFQPGVGWTKVGTISKEKKMATDRGKPNFGYGGNQGSGNFGQAGSAVAEKGKEAAESAEGLVAGAAEKAKEVAAAAAQKAGDAASFIGEKAEQATAGVGSGMKSLAGTIREHTPASGMFHSAGQAVADSLESGGRFLQEEGLKGMAEDFTGLIRRNPIPSVLVAIGLGFLIARATRS